MAALAMVVSTMDDLMRRMNWTKEEEKMVIIISVAASLGLTLLILGVVCFEPIVTALRRRWAMLKLRFRRKDHGEVEYYEFEETTGSVHGGRNSRRASAEEASAEGASGEGPPVPRRAASQ